MSKSDPAVVEESAPRGKGRKNNPEKTRQDILRAAIDEFVAQGLSGARVDAIAERTHTSKRMIYYYFGSKEQLYQAVLEKLYSDIRGIEGTLRLGALPPAKAMEKLVEFSFDYHDRHVDFVRIISIENIHKGEHIASSELVQSVNSSIVQSIAEILRRGEAEGVPRRAGGARRAHADQFVLLLPGVQSLHRVADLSHRPARRRGSPAAPADDWRGGIALHPCLTPVPLLWEGAPPVAQAGEVRLHARGVGRHPAEQFECLHRLEHRHGAAVQCAAAEGAGLAQQLGFQRKVDHPATHRSARNSSAGTGMPGSLAMPTGVVLTNPWRRPGRRPGRCRRALVARRSAG